MTNKFMDMDNEALVRYISRLEEDFVGVQRIMHIFIKLKNEIMYDTIKKTEQPASETLVMGYGNNFNKNNLLCAVLQLADYQCELRYKNVKDNTKWLFSRNSKIIPWYYVKVNYYGTVINLDCSFDRRFMNAARIVYQGDKVDYRLEDFHFEGGKLFEVVSDPYAYEIKAAKYRTDELGSGRLCI